MAEHVVSRINDGYYVCDTCGKAGSEQWAIFHQFDDPDSDPPEVFITELPESCRPYRRIVTWDT